MTEEGLAGLVEWLREQSEELMKSAIARESTAETMRAATPKELREAKALAEKMAGRKLPNVSTGAEETKIEADVQCRIAAKLSDRARQIAAWADELAALEAAAPPSTARRSKLELSIAEEGLKPAIDLLNDAIWNYRETVTIKRGDLNYAVELAREALATPSPQPSVASTSVTTPRKITWFCRICERDHTAYCPAVSEDNFLHLCDHCGQSFHGNQHECPAPAATQEQPAGSAPISAGEPVWVLGRYLHKFDEQYSTVELGDGDCAIVVDDADIKRDGK